MAKNRNTPPKNIVRFMVAIGLAIFLSGAIKGLGQYLTVNLWPATRGEVTKSQVTTVSDTGHSTRYQPEVEFRYTVHGTEFVAKTVAKSDAVSYPEARRIANSYSAGTQHVIHYNPADPADVRANAGYTLDFFLWPIALVGFGLALIFIPLGALAATRRPAKLRDPAQGMMLIGGLFAVVGVCLIFIGGWIGYSTRTMLKTWPAVDAQVISSRVHRYVQTNTNNQKRESSSFEVIVEFRYPAAGQEYLSPSSMSCTSSNEANQALALYAPGSWQEIRYNPTDPNDIRFNMDSDLWLSFYIVTGLGTFFALFGGAFVLVVRQQQTQSRASNESTVKDPDLGPEDSPLTLTPP
jgi:energy-converting hydrogenase Eha subunit E